MIGKTPAVLFVCTANICRSPMAAALFRAKLQEVVGGDTWLIDSAGTWAKDGQRVSINSAKVMESRGLDIFAHRSKTVSKALLDQYDLILVMEPGHKEALRVEFSQAAGRIFLLSELSGPPVAIDDPYGMSLERYEKTAVELEGYIDAALPKILDHFAGYLGDTLKFPISS
jgi:protein-tyrosine-phosphatase